MHLALRAAEQQGAETQVFGGAFLANLPHFLTEGTETSSYGTELIEAVRRADGLILASPGYHGSISGLVKNAIDYFEMTAKDSRIYLDGVPVGLISTAYGWQATGTTLTALRSIVHALRGWPTPLGAGINSSGKIFRDGECVDPQAATQLDLVGRQVVRFANLHRNDHALTRSAAAQA